MQSDSPSQYAERWNYRSYRCRKGWCELEVWSLAWICCSPITDNLDGVDTGWDWYEADQRCCRLWNYNNWLSSGRKRKRRDYSIRLCNCELERGSIKLIWYSWSCWIWIWSRKSFACTRFMSTGPWWFKGSWSSNQNRSSCCSKTKSSTHSLCQ